MKKKDYTDLKSKSVKDLLKMVSAKTNEAAKKQMEIAGGKEKNLKVVANLRRDIAQILTLVKQKEIVEALKEVGTK